MQRQAKKRSGDAGGAGGTKRAVTPRSAFIVLACTAIAEYFAFYLRLADAGAKAGIPHGGYVMCALICGVASLATTAGFGLLLFAERNRITKNLKQLLITAILLLVSTFLPKFPQEYLDFQKLLQRHSSGLFLPHCLSEDIVHTHAQL